MRTYEIKTSRGGGANAYENIVKTAKGQAENVILNLEHSPLDEVERERQIKSLDETPYIDFVQEIVVVFDGRVDRVLKRKS